MIKYIFIFIALTSCSYFPDYDINIEGLYSLDDIANWIDNNIEYKADKIGNDDWQTPQETYDIRIGDCEDMVLLYMYLAKEYFGLDSEFLWTKTSYYCHAIAKCKNKYYYFIEEQNKNNLFILWTFDYESAMWMAENN